MKKKFNEDIYFTPKQAAEYFNLSLSTVKNYIYAGRLKTLKTPGGHHRIRKSEVLSTLGDRIAPTRDNAYEFSLIMALCNAMLAAFKTLGPMAKPLTLHAQKVSELCAEIARAMAMSESDIKRAKVTGLVHDIGHIGIDRRVLLKPCKFTDHEYESVKIHPGLGAEILSSTKGLEVIACIIAQHHERIDGKGYPKGLSGKEIQKFACIISIAEAYDSMTSEYSYKRPVSKDMAIAELMRHRGAQFDGDIVEVAVKLI